MERRLPREELLCIICGCNLLWLVKLDFTRHPMAQNIIKASILNYHPARKALPPSQPKAGEAVEKRRQKGAGSTVWRSCQMNFKYIDISIDKKDDIFIDAFQSYTYNKRNGIIKETLQECTILF